MTAGARTTTTASGAVANTVVSGVADMKTSSNEMKC